MRASLDTNAIIHFYRANLQNIIFDFFKDGVFIYEQIRNVELKNHGNAVIFEVDADIAAGKMEIYTDSKLKEQGVYKIFQNNVREKNGTFGRESYKEIVLLRYFREALKN